MRRRHEKVIEHVRTRLQVQAGRKLVVAVSGGLDSVALLDILVRLREDLDLRLVVAHLDHGIRRSSVRDAVFVEKLAAGHNLPFVGKRVALSGSNLEEQAREARYAFLESVRKRRRADFIVTAHQADDQVETLFLHLTRGAGLAGLSGMKEASGVLLRPLLGISRRDLSRYVRRHRLAYRLDPTNRSLKIARNRVRRQVITSLSRINPQLIETVSQSMRVLDEEYGVLRALAEQEAARVSVGRTKSAVTLSLPKLRKLRKGLRHLVWREIIRELVGDLRGYRLQHLENLDDLLQRRSGSRIHLPHGLRAVREYDHLVLRSGGSARPPTPQRLPVPGTARFGDLVLKATKSARQADVRVDATTVGRALRVRPPKVGDRFKPVGLRGSKLVSDLLTDLKVPRDERPWVPVVVTAAGDIVWVAGYRADRRFVPRPGRAAVGLSVKRA